MQTQNVRSESPAAAKWKRIRDALGLNYRSGLGDVLVEAMRSKKSAARRALDLPDTISDEQLRAEIESAFEDAMNESATVARSQMPLERQIDLVWASPFAQREFNSRTSVAAYLRAECEGRARTGEMSILSSVASGALARIAALVGLHRSALTGDIPTDVAALTLAVTPSNQPAVAQALGLDSSADITLILEALQQCAEMNAEFRNSRTAFAGAATVMSRVSPAPTKAGGRPVDNFRMLPFGYVSLVDPAAGHSFHFTRVHAGEAIGCFEAMGGTLEIDFDHNMVGRGATPAGERRRWAGSIGGMEIRGDGLYATNVSWAPDAKALIAGGQYRYFSPVVYWESNDYRHVTGLGPVAITNHPAIPGLPPLVET